MRSKNLPPRDEAGDNKFVFLAHWVETWNWLLWWLDDLHDHPEHARRWYWLAPLYWTASVVYLVSRRAYNVVDSFVFSGIRGETWLIRNFAWHFLRKGWQKLIRARIYQAVLDAQERGFEVIGLGALTKAEWLTGGGEWIVRDLGDKLKTPIVHGDTMTAAVVVRQAVMLTKRFGLENSSMFLIGGTSKIGRATALSLVGRGVRVLLYTDSRERFARIREEAGENSRLLQHVTSLSEGRDCALWITGKCAPKGRTLLRCIPKNAVVLNFSVPDPLTPRLLRTRTDIFHFDGGLVGYDPNNTTLRFTMRLRRGLTYACHAGTIIHAAMAWKNHEVGQVELGQLDVVWNAGEKLGFKLPPPTSFLRPVDLPTDSKDE